MIDIDELQSVVGRRLPDGEYTIDPGDHATLLEAIHTAESGVLVPDGIAHPIYGHIATHCGMGVGIEELWSTVGTGLDDGVVFGQGRLQYEDVIRTGVPYSVRSTISGIDRKAGRRTGTFDAMTVTMELVDAQGRLVATCDETYILPRRERS